jgi:hypothetical protein
MAMTAFIFFRSPRPSAWVFPRSNSFFSILCGAILMLGLLVSPRPTDADEAPMDGYKEINAFELKQMIDGDAKAVVINVLSEMEYESQHIRGSINIPVVEMRQTDKLPADRQTPLIFHCQSER